MGNGTPESWRSRAAAQLAPAPRIVIGPEPQTYFGMPVQEWNAYGAAPALPPTYPIPSMFPCDDCGALGGEPCRTEVEH